MVAGVRREERQVSWRHSIACAIHDGKPCTCKETPRPMLLDLFCGAGGAGMGYYRAGFDVVGVDINPQPNYPFPFIQADAIEYLRDWLRDGPTRVGWHVEADAIHASPPCQAHTSLSARWRGRGTAADQHLDLIAATRELLVKTGLPYVIENVEGASRKLRSPVTVCGATVGLMQSRHRLFECRGFVPLVPRCSCRGREFKNVIGQRPDGRWLRKKADGTRANYVVSSLEEGRELMGIEWMEWRELCESIPPAYTELIGLQLAGYLSANKETPSSDAISGCC